MKEKDSIYIFDTNIFLTGIDFNLFKGVIYTTPSIIDEVNDSRYKEKNRNILNKINAAIETRKLKVKSPKNEYITKIRDFFIVLNVFFHINFIRYNRYIYLLYLISLISQYKNTLVVIGIYTYYNYH